MINYVWSIRSMESHPHESGFDNVVDRVEWMIAGDEGDNVARIGGRTNLNPVVPSDFTEYANLTEAQVLEWVFAILGPDAIAALEASIAAQIATMQSPPTTTLPLPWG